jgi:K(+)-stimulated pyrophosphate-energized sodium pump
MYEIHNYIKRGALLYLKHQARALLIILAILIIPVGYTGIEYLDDSMLGFFITALVFLIGATTSLTAGFIGMRAATKANILVVEVTKQDPNEGFKLAYYGGMITGILNISMFVLAIWIILIATQGNNYLLISYGFGASITALITQVGGGIFTKSADIGADFVGKYEMGIKEDDSRNPAIIADLVGDNVGDCAGRGADLFNSATSDAIGGMILGLTIFLLIGDPIFIISGLTIISMGLFSLFFTTYFLKINFNKPSRSIWRVFIAAIGFNVVVLLILNLTLFSSIGILLFFSSLAGLLAEFLMILLTISYTSIDFKHTRQIAESSVDGVSTNIIIGLSAGLKSVFFPILLYGISFIFAYLFGYIFGNIYYYDILSSPSVDQLGNAINPKVFLIAFGILGVNLASVSTDMINSTILSFDTFGPILDNAAGIVQIVEEEAPPGLRENLDRLDAVGNTTKAVAKGYALMSGGFSSIVMFLTFLLSIHTLAGNIQSSIPYIQLSNIFDYLDLYNPFIIVGLCLGVAVPVLFSSIILKSVQKGAKKIMNEARKQFKEKVGLREGKAKPNYEKCINISANTALKDMMKPVALSIIIGISFGILIGPMGAAAFMIGNLIGCLILGIFMSIGGASFDNAKKGIEAGLFGGKGSKAHMAAIVGDTIGDPLKDTAGPSMNILITTINTMLITFLPLFIMTAFLWGISPI